MGIFSTLIGRKSVKGPDHNSKIHKILHIENTVSIEYELPTNMSALLNFNERYQNESPKTLYADANNSAGYESYAWLSGINVDGAFWDYTGSFWTTGVGGKLSSLHLKIFISKHDGELTNFISNRYDEYLNGPNGINTQTKEALEPGRDEKEIDELLLKKPQNIKIKAHNGLDFYHWNIDRELSGGKLSFYYVLPLKNNTMLSFCFYRSLSAKNDREVTEQEQRIINDISVIMNSVKVLDK